MELMRLPFFPLHVVVFPHLPLPVHIFEPRYRALARDVLAAGSPYAGRFVVSMITEGQEAFDDPATQLMGTVCEVRTAERLADGRYVLLGVGVARVLIGSIDRSGEYATVEVRPLPEVAGAGAERLVPVAQAALDEYLATVKRFVATSASMGSEPQETRDVSVSLDKVLKPIRLPDDPLAASYAVGGVLQIELTRKQQLLELPDAATRLRAEIDLLRRESALLADAELPPISSSPVWNDTARVWSSRSNEICAPPAVSSTPRSERCSWLLWLRTTCGPVGISSVSCGSCWWGERRSKAHWRNRRKHSRTSSSGSRITRPRSTR
jgi:uncharacterized protein